MVLCDGVRREKVRVKPRDGEPGSEVSIERLVLPNRLLAESAVAHAPFPLPKVPVRVSQYWTFKTGTGDTPTLPIVAFQVFHLGLYDDLVEQGEDIADENDDADDVTTPDDEVPECPDDIASRRQTLVAVEEDEPCGGDVEREPEERHDQQHRGKGRELERPGRVHADQQDHERERDRERQQQVDQQRRQGQDHDQHHPDQRERDGELAGERLHARGAAAAVACGIGQCPPSPGSPRSAKMYARISATAL